MELGVAVCVVEDQYQFILHHKLLWKEDDVEVAVPMIEETQALYPDLHAVASTGAFTVGTTASDSTTGSS